MENMKENFSFGIVFALLFTCLQSYGFIKHGALVTDGPVVENAILFGLLFFVGWIFVCACAISVIRFVYQFIIYFLQSKREVEQPKVVEAYYDEHYPDEDEQLYTLYFDEKDREIVEEALRKVRSEKINY